MTQASPSGTPGVLRIHRGSPGLDSRDYVPVRPVGEEQGPDAVQQFRRLRNPRPMRLKLSCQGRGAGGVSAHRPVDDAGEVTLKGAPGLPLGVTAIAGVVVEGAGA